jgi:hypothetical protein
VGHRAHQAERGGGAEAAGEDAAAGRGVATTRARPRPGRCGGWLVAVGGGCRVGGAAALAESLEASGAIVR